MIVRVEHRISQRLLLLITKAGDEKRISRVMDFMKLPIYYQIRGQGTAPSELLDLCGLQGTMRILTLSILPKEMVHEVFQIFEHDLQLKKRGGGIAVTIPVTGMQDVIRKILVERTNYSLPESQSEVKKMIGATNHINYSMIFVAANYGYSDEIIDAARRAGAKGGTILKGRRRGSENVMNFLGVPMQEEQEFSIIIVPQEKKTAVMVAISRECGLKTPAHGVILAVPVEETLGLEDNSTQTKKDTTSEV